MDVLLINASYQVLARIDWQRAVTLLVLGEAEAVENDPERVIHSRHLTVPLPTIVRLREYRHVPFRPGEVAAPSFARIKLRDGKRCAYCGGPGDTVDHVLPRSRGGADTWDNLACACRGCNNRKADRTPVEAGMRLRWTPRPVLPDVADQDRVWALLRNAG